MPSTFLFHDPDVVFAVLSGCPSEIRNSHLIQTIPQVAVADMGDGVTGRLGMSYPFPLISCATVDGWIEWYAGRQYPRVSLDIQMAVFTKTPSVISMGGDHRDEILGYVPSNILYFQPAEWTILPRNPEHPITVETILPGKFPGVYSLTECRDYSLQANGLKGVIKGNELFLVSAPLEIIYMILHVRNAGLILVKVEGMGGVAHSVLMLRGRPIMSGRIVRASLLPQFCTLDSMPSTIGEAYDFGYWDDISPFSAGYRKVHLQQSIQRQLGLRLVPEADVTRVWSQTSTRNIAVRSPPPASSRKIVTPSATTGMQNSARPQEALRPSPSSVPTRVQSSTVSTGFGGRVLIKAPPRKKE